MHVNIPRFQVRGPKGGLLTRSVTAARLAELLPAWIRRWKTVTVEPSSPAPPPPPTPRQLIVRLCQWAIAHQAEIHYAQTRPIPLRVPGELPKLPLTTDCSGFATIAYRYAGALDPNGLAYNGAGYTGSMLEQARKRGTVVPVGSVRPGDLAFFGVKSDPTGHHVGVVIAVREKTHAGVQLASHGSESGPLEISAAE